MSSIDVITTGEITKPPTNQNQPVAKLNLMDIEARALLHAAEIFDEAFKVKKQSGNEFFACTEAGTIAMYKFDLVTSAWSLDLKESKSFYETAIAIEAPTWVPGLLEYLTETWKHKSGSGVISYLSLTLYAPIMDIANWLWDWLDDNYPDETISPTNTDPNTLYGAELLEHNSEDPILLSFGEQAGYASHFLLPHFLCLAIRNGAAIDKLDFTLFNGHTVFIWPDHGEVGQKLAGTVIKKLFKTNPKAVICKLSPLMYQPLNDYPWKFKPRKKELPLNYNATDAVAEGWSVNDFGEVFGRLCRLVIYKFDNYQVENFMVKEDGIYEVIYKDGEESFSKISSRIEVVALTRDDHSKNWGLQLRFEDHDGIVHEWAMPKEMLAGGGDAYREVLLAWGADIYVGKGNKDKLTQYFLDAKPKPRSLCVSNIGWNGHVFVLPQKTYGKSHERVILQTANAKKTPSYSVRGSLTEWKDNVGVLCFGNSRIILAVCVALTGPFLNPLNLENGGFHFRGASSTGKTKTESVAASIYGSGEMLNSWKSTGNALESMAREHNDTVLLLDELEQVESQEAGNIAYMLGNGQGKARANIHGDAKSIVTWRLLFLSTGEIGLAEHIAASGGRIRAGMEVRMLDIPADARAGYGVFENIHGAPSPAAFADSLKALSETYYGSPADALLTRITKSGELDQAVAYIRQVQEQFVKQYVPVDAHGQVTRAAMRFGAVAGVGEYCISIGILPWESGHAIWGVRECYLAWLESRGDNSASEDIRALAQVREYLERNGESRFTLIEPDGYGSTGIVQRTINRTGFKKVMDDGSLEYWILPEMYKTEICHGFDPKLVTRVLREREILIPNSQGESQCGKRIPGIGGTARVYVIRSIILQDNDIGHVLAA